MKDLSRFDPAKAGFRFTPHAHRDNSCQPELSRRLYILMVIHIINKRVRNHWRHEIVDKI